MLLSGYGVASRAPRNQPRNQPRNRSMLLFLQEKCAVPVTGLRGFVKIIQCIACHVWHVPIAPYWQPAPVTRNPVT